MALGMLSGQALPRVLPASARETGLCVSAGRDEGTGAGDTSEGAGEEVVFIPLETVVALLAGEEEENSVQVED